jgi:two-component system nitrogen regulation sensor histidine kinase NtrY
MKRSGRAYQRVFDEQSALIKKFIIIFVLFSCALLLGAILLGLSFARRLTDPIGALVAAAESMRSGTLKQVEVMDSTMEELSLLMRTFNAMVHEMHTQKENLIIVNQQLEERSNCLSNVLSSVSSGVLGIEPTGRILLSNERAQTLLGITHSIEQVSLQDVYAEFWNFVKAAHLEPGQQSQTHMTLLQHGVARIYALYIRSWSNGAELTLTFDDITELVAAQKRSVWEDVARRVAHEVKNPLTPISLSAQRLKRRFLHCVDHPEILEDCVNTIIKQVTYIDQLISEFSSFARMAEMKLSIFSLYDTLHRMINFHQHAYANLEFTLHIDEIEEMRKWRGDEGQLERALTNLIKNSIEAIQERPESHIELGRIQLSVHALHNGIQITVQDNGIGFSHDTPLFFCDPYVTTKKNGTGLGLAIVQRIVSEHQGNIHLKACPQGGAMAVIVLPFLGT